MCGIVAVSGASAVLNDAILGLKRLEYRGYDSSGLAFNDEDGDLQCVKFAGKVKVLEDNISKMQYGETLIRSVIGHTRWATHGTPNHINAHPHYNDEVAVVHNGIIENYLTLKESLISKGYVFKSETDTEVILFLIYDFLQKGFTKFEAAQKLLSTLQGSFAIAILYKNDNSLYGVKRGSPMVVGYGSQGKNFIASDVYAIAGLASHISYIDDDEIVIISENDINIFNSYKELISKEKQEIKVQPNNLEKGNYPHFMLKEIHEQSGSIRENILNHYNEKKQNIIFPHFKEDLSKFNHIKIISCGTSYNASLIARSWFEKYSKIEINVYVASEFVYSDIDLQKEKTLYIFISQSGETADTLKALKKVRHDKVKSSKTLAIINVVESQIKKLSDYYIECFCGPEIGVAATKSFTAQLISLAFLSLKFALEKKVIKKNTLIEIVKKQIHLVPNKIDDFLSNKHIESSIDKFCVDVADGIKSNLKIIYIGRGVLSGVCREAALKTQELFYIPILSFPAGELKHGPIAILDSKTLVIVLSNSELLHNKMSSSIEEMSARDAKIALISNLKHDKAEYFLDTSIFGDFSDFTTPILYSIPLHLLSYKIALFLKNDVDKPRGLAKSVTVE